MASLVKTLNTVPLFRRSDPMASWSGELKVRMMCFYQCLCLSVPTYFPMTTGAIMSPWAVCSNPGAVCSCHRDQQYFTDS